MKKSGISGTRGRPKGKVTERPRTRRGKRDAAGKRFEVEKALSGRKSCGKGERRG